MARVARSAIVILSGAAASCALFGVSSPADATRGPCPAAMSIITTDADPHGFCIDRYEGSIVEIKDGREVNHAPYEPVTGIKVKAVSRVGVVPQGYISKNEAELACKAANKRLCTSTEWQTACRGRKPTKYPYGDEHKDGYCNDSGRAPISTLHPELTQDELYSSNAALNDPRVNQSPNTVAPTAKYEHCKNAYGVFDMVGNLHEWTADVSATNHGTFRGGYYQDTHINGDGCDYKTVAHDVSYHDYSTGFRCCADWK
jgi:hypothetical protein